MKVFAYEDGTACGYYRIRMPFDEMARHGVDATYATTGPVPADTQVLVGQRVGGVGRQLDWLKSIRGRRFVWETDDDLWNIDPYNVRAARHFVPEVLTGVEAVMRLARLVTVTTPALAAAMSRHNPRTAVLPNVIDAALLEVERPRRDRVVVGWAGGDSHQRDLEAVAPLLRRFFSRTPHVELHTIGWGSQRPPQAFPEHLRQFVHPNPLHAIGAAYRHTYWSTDLFDYYRSIDFDIGIAPLLPNDFNRAKSAIKALEYAALGIPVVASDVGPYRDFVKHGETGLLVRSGYEWERHLRALTNDEAMRAELGANAKKEAARWTIQEHWSLWEQTYRALL